MTYCFNYTPGQLVTFYQEVKDGYDQRTDDGYIPVVTRIIVPGFTLACDYPRTMTRIDVGLFYFQFLLPNGASAVGTYFVDIIYMNPDTGLLVNASRQIVVTAPFGNFGLTPGGLGGPPIHPPPPCHFPPEPDCHHDHHERPDPYDRYEHHDPCPPPCPAPYPHEPLPLGPRGFVRNPHRPFRGGGR
jgi:hypothetical protein